MAKQNSQKQLPQELSAEQALITAQNALNGGDYKLAVSLMLSFVQAAPHFAPGHLALGLSFNRLARWPEAVKCLSHAVELIDDPDQPEAPTPQVEAGRRFNSFMAHIELARALINTGDLDTAADTLENTIPVTDNTNTLDAHKARLELARGNAPAAAEIVTPRLALQDTDIEIAMVAAEIATQAPEALAPESIADHLIATSKRVGLPAGILIALLQAAALVCDSCERFDDAVSCWRRAASLPKVSFKQRAFLAEISATMHGWTPEAFSKIVRAKTDDSTPILLVGLPGRGIDTIAKLIAAHPDAENAGPTEFLSFAAQHKFNAPVVGNFIAMHRPGVIRTNIAKQASEQYTRSLRSRVRSDSAKRVIDSNAINSFQLGMLAAMNPNAQIVHITDDPFNACFDAWSSNNAYAYPFIAEPQSLAIYWKGESALSKHWTKTFTSDSARQPYHEINLETFREAPEETARALFMFLGLDWSDSIGQATQDLVRAPRPDPKDYLSKLKALTSAIDIVTSSAGDLEPIASETT